MKIRLPAGQRLWSAPRRWEAPSPQYTYGTILGRNVPGPNLQPGFRERASMGILLAPRLGFGCKKFVVVVRKEVLFAVRL